MYLHSRASPCSPIEALLIHRVTQDWWLTPELYLRRPPAYNQEWRVDRLLKRKAEEGVKIYVVVYKEVTQTMSMSSSHTKARRDALLWERAR